MVDVIDKFGKNLGVELFFGDFLREVVDDRLGIVNVWVFKLNVEVLISIKFGVFRFDFGLVLGVKFSILRLCGRGKMCIGVILKVV